MGAILGKIKKLLMPVLMVLAVLSLAVGLLLSGLLPFSVQLSTGGTSAAAAPSAPPPTPTPVPYFQPPPELDALVGGIYYDTGQRIVNLADPGGFRYLRTKIVLEFLPDTPDFYKMKDEERLVAEEAFRARVDRQRPLIEDVITNVLTSKTFDEIFTVEGKMKLKEELREELNRRLRKFYVQRVLITDFVIQ